MASPRAIEYSHMMEADIALEVDCLMAVILHYTV